MFYSTLPSRANDNVINYDNVCVMYKELGTSLARADKVVVHTHVMNAFCRKLFKDRHPSKSRRHYFFSPVGDYLIGNEGSPSYLKANCEKCFKYANQCFNFKSSDFLIFPILHDGHCFVFIAAIHDGFFVFLDSVFDEDHLYQEKARSVIIPNFVKAWDQFIGYEFDFEDFVFHYAAVPKQDKNFWSPHDDGIFVMKYLELWDPYVNMMVQFSSININDIRMQYAIDMVFNNHNNQNNDAKELLSNFDGMLKLKRSQDFQAASSIMM